MGRISGGLVSGFWVFTVLVAVFGVVLNVPVVLGSGTIYIRADGSIDPPIAPITTADNVTYTFTDNIIDDSIVVERSDITIDGNRFTIEGIEYMGGFYLCGITNVTVENTNIKGFYWGVFLNLSSGCNILGNNITGIYLDSSSNNIICGNNITRIQAWGSNYTNITENNMKGGGIDLYESNFATITGNRIESLWPNYDYGIILSSCDNSVLFENNVTNCRFGITVSVSSNCTLSRNCIESLWHNYNFHIISSELSDFMHSIDVSNLINGKPIYYLVNQTDLVIDLATYPEVGYLGLINCCNITVEDLTLETNGEGLLMAYTNNSRIISNIIEDNLYGILLTSSFNNILYRNTISNYQMSYDRYGVCLTESSNNSLWENAIYNTYPNVAIFDSFDNIVSRNIITSPIWLHRSSDNTLSGNTLTYGAGIYLHNSSGNRISGHCFSNEFGFRVSQSSNNHIYHNNFLRSINPVLIESADSVNMWDEDWPSGGNYWRNYTGADNKKGTDQDQPGSDGIGDAPFIIDVLNRDRYPLMAPFTVFDAGTWNGEAYSVDIVSNSTLSDFKLNVTQKTLSFNVTGLEGEAGFSRVTIPNVIVEDLWQGNFTVFLNGEHWPFRNWTDHENTYIYVNYTHSEHQIIIIPEFPLATILPLFTILSIVVVIFAKKKRRKERPDFQNPFF